MKKSIAILSVAALLLVSMPLMAMGLAEEARAAGIYYPGQDSPVEVMAFSIDDAADFVKANYDKSTKSNPAPRTTADFEVYDSITIMGIEYRIAWSTDTDQVVAVPLGDHIVKIDINEGAPDEIVYNLIATISDPSGESVTINMPKTLPQGSLDPSFEETVIAAYLLADGEFLPKEVRLAGTVVAIPTAYSEKYGNITVNIQIGAMADNLIQCYRLSGEGVANLKEGDLITVEGKVKNYKGTIEFDKPVLVGMGDLPSQSAVLEKAFALAEGEAMKGTQILIGTIESIPTAYSEKYGNITVNLAVEDRIVQAYRLNGGADLQIGDTIAVVGTIKNYKGTIEFDKNCQQVKVENYRSVKTLLKAYELEEGKALEGSRQVTGTVVEIPTAYSEQYGNITVNLVTDGLEALKIQCYRLKGGSDLQIGDTIMVSGIIKNYKGTIEFDKNCTYVKAE